MKSKYTSSLEKAMTDIDDVSQSRDITVPIKVHIIKAMVFPCRSVWMWELGHEEGWRIDAFEWWCGKRLLRVPWTAKRLYQSILEEINPEYQLEGLMLKLKLQYFGHLMWRADSLEKTLMLGKTEGKRRGVTEDEIVGWHHWPNGHEFEQTLGDSEGQGSPCFSPWGCRVRHDLVTEQQIQFVVIMPPYYLLWILQVTMKPGLRNNGHHVEKYYRQWTARLDI